MNDWRAFQHNPPKQFDALTDEEKEDLDAAVAAYIDECLRQRGVDQTPPTDRPA